jgi:hypothetical protein
VPTTALTLTAIDTFIRNQLQPVADGGGADIVCPASQTTPLHTGTFKLEENATYRVSIPCRFYTYGALATEEALIELDGPVGTYDLLQPSGLAVNEHGAFGGFTSVITIPNGGSGAYTVQLTENNVQAFTFVDASAPAPGFIVVERLA